MSFVRLVALTLLASALPHMVRAQEWADAYTAGDYATAARLLHVVVTSPDYVLRPDDPEPARYLSLLYSRGLGIPRDPIAACALAQLTQDVEIAGPKSIDDVPAYKAVLREREQFVRRQCEALSYEDRRKAVGAMGCFAFGLHDQTLEVGGSYVRIGRDGIAVAESDERPSDLPMCPVLFARAKPISVSPPENADPDVTPRHFLELFTWHVVGGRAHGGWQYVLMWHLYEVSNHTLAILTLEELEVSATWPDPPAPAGLDSRVAFEMLRSGNIRWRLAGAPPKRGWLLQEKKAP